MIPGPKLELEHGSFLLTPSLNDAIVHGFELNLD